MKVCVIGAGAAGLISIKRSLEFNCEVIAFELTNKVSGLWNYTDEVGKDKYGIDIHSSMYEGLHTNLAIEAMSYPDHPFREQKESFVSSDEVLNYYKIFADEYALKKYIKFEHYVVNVRPLINDTWEVLVKTLQTGAYETYNFDAVLVCSGHFNSGFIPKYKGQQIFEGKQIHSHDYRSSVTLKDEKVLVIGGSYSGFDIVLESSKHARHVAWSHHLKKTPDVSNFSENVTQRPDVAEFHESGAKFVDGTSEDFTFVIYCTGYDYRFPFLSVDCGISTEDDYVKPLFMQCISIKRPTLGMIGLCNLICPNSIFDMQARFCLAFMTGKKKLPSKEKMMEQFIEDIEERIKLGQPNKKFHYLGERLQHKYLVDLASMSGTKPVMPCLSKIHTQCGINRNNNLFDFKNIKFHILDEENFTMSRIERD